MKKPRATVDHLRTILHVELDAFFASVEEALHPELKGKAIVVRGEGGVVAGSNYAARSFGIHPATPIATAQRLAPQATVVAGHFAEYERASRTFFTILNRFTDRVEPVSLDEAYLDLTRLPYPFLTAEDAGRAIQKKIRDELGVSASIGVAPNKVCAKVASELAKPGRVVVVRRGEETSFLDSLPVNLLPGVGSRTEAFLKAFGVRTIGQLRQLPQTLLYEHFGRGGLGLWQFSHGIDRRPVEAAEAEKSLSKRQTFSRATDDPFRIAVAVRNLLGELCQRLKEHGQHAQTVSLEVRSSDGARVRRQRTLEVPSNAIAELTPNAEALLVDVLTRSPAAKTVSVTLTNLTRANREESVFVRSFSRLRQIQDALSRIRNQFGFGAQGAQ